MEQAGFEEFMAMPQPGVLQMHASDGLVLVSVGTAVLYRYEAGDTGMRNLAIVSLTDAGQRVDEVAAVFGLSATYVSILRRKAREQGSTGLVARRGRPPKLSEHQVRKARRWAAEGWTQQAIADRSGVAQSVISELLARLGPALVQQELPELSGQQYAVEPTGQSGPEGAGQAVTDEGAESEPGASARITTGRYRSRYAGAMLLHTYLARVGAESIFATLTGAPSRRYDDLAVATTATLAFALGAGTVEGTKHLRRAEAGPAVGIDVTPELRTLRTRLGALADDTDPLAVQRAFATAMLAADPAPDPVYFVDDHFVAYTGARPVAKGWNTKRRHTEAGRDDTLLVDARGRAVVFDSGEPTGLASTLPPVLAQLREVIGADAPVLLGFDRGGAFPSTFTACREAGADWITYRRAPLAETSAIPTKTVTLGDRRPSSVVLADETVQLKGYGPARQLTLFEHEAPVLQVLTSDTTAEGAALLGWLRACWRIENMFKYASEHNGIDALACYDMDIAPDPRMVKNPARAGARTVVKTAEVELVAAERARPQLLDGEGTPKQKNAALPGAHQRIWRAQNALAEAKTTMRPIPAKIPATTLDPAAKRAYPHVGRRGLQMVLRLLAFNAEAWLAEHLNVFLADSDEDRATTRHLLHQGGHIDYRPTTITVTLDRPDTPRITGALQALLDELNHTPTHLPGDPRPITYQLARP